MRFVARLVGSGFLEQSRPGRRANTIWTVRRGRVDLFLKHSLVVLVAIRSAATVTKTWTQTGISQIKLLAPAR